MKDGKHGLFELQIFTLQQFSAEPNTMAVLAVHLLVNSSAHIRNVSRVCGFFHGMFFVLDPWEKILMLKQ